MIYWVFDVKGIKYCMIIVFEDDDEMCGMFCEFGFMWFFIVWVLCVGYWVGFCFDKIGGIYCDVL